MEPRSLILVYVFLIAMMAGVSACSEKLQPLPQPQPPITPQPQLDWPTDNDDTYVPMNYYY